MLPPLGRIESFIPSMRSNRVFKLASTPKAAGSLSSYRCFSFLFSFSSFIQAMRRSDRNVRSLGICQRLFNLVMNSLTARGFRRITAVRPGSHHSNGLPVQESASRNGEQLAVPTMPNGEKGIARSEIIVEFRHANAMDSWTAVDKLDSLVSVAEEDSLIMDGDTTRLKKATEHRDRGNETDHFEPSGIMKPYKRASAQAQDKAGSVTRGKDLKEPEPLPTTTKDHAQGPKKSVSVRENRRGEEESNSIRTEKPTPTVEPGDRKMKPQGHHVRPLLSVVPNINEKSEAFISSRKKAMGRNLSHEPKKS